MFYTSCILTFEISASDAKERARHASCSSVHIIPSHLSGHISHLIGRHSTPCTCCFSTKPDTLSVCTSQRTVLLYYKYKYSLIPGNQLNQCSPLSSDTVQIIKIKEKKVSLHEGKKWLLNRVSTLIQPDMRRFRSSEFQHTSHSLTRSNHCDCFCLANQDSTIDKVLPRLMLPCDCFGSHQ